MTAKSIEKLLSANDTGETGSHMAGILVPKDQNFLNFFPTLNKSVKNPRAPLDLLDDTGREWTFNFIYYNNRFFGGTRNEYRLTGMTAFLREFNLHEGDSLIFSRISPGYFRVSYRRKDTDKKTIKLSPSWKIIET